MKSNFFKEKLGRLIVTFLGIFIIILTIAITIFLIKNGISTFTVHKHSISEFLFGTNWSPGLTDTPGQQSPIGAATFIVGSFCICGIALLIATPFSLAAAIFIAEISPDFGKKLLQPAVEIFVGIPSVIYGWVGLNTLVPLIGKVFKLPFGGYTMLAGGIVLSVMIFPTITSVSTDAIRNVHQDYKEASYALGSTRWQMIRLVSLKDSTPGILTGIVLGLTRAFGEALAVSMVVGGSILMPKSIFSSVNTLTTQIARNMKDSTPGTQWTDSLWSMALLLFFISFLCILFIRIIGRRGAHQK